MSKETIIEEIHVFGFETDGRFSGCNLTVDSIKKRIQNKNNRALKVEKSPQNPSFRERTYEEAFIPIDEFASLKQSSSTNICPDSAVTEHINPIISNP